MIEVSGLTKTYGNKRGITDISFTINEGEIVGFLGPNGAGKSTTMNVITGYLSATAGAAKVAGIDILENPLEAKKHIGYLPQDPPLYLDMTVDEYLNFIYDIKGVKSAGKDRKEHIDRICEMVGITHVRSRVINNLSGGYKQRCGLAQALVGDPDVLILDEPTAGLDPVGRESILENIRAYQSAQGASVIMVSHSMEEIASNVDRLLVMNDSHLVMDATPAEVFAKPEELVQMGLAVPKVTQVLLKLRELGVDVPASAFTVEQAEKLLLPLLKGGKAAC